MKINPDKLKTRAAQAGVSVEALARAVERTGLMKGRASSAIQNWMRGSDHPRCKAEDVRAMAQALGCEAKDIVRFTTVFRYHRGSPRKAALLVDLIRGKQFDQAMNLLTFTTKRAAVDVKQALMAAYSEAEQAGADAASLVVTHSAVSNGPVMKRFQPKDRGRAHPILKRMTHITVGVEER